MGVAATVVAVTVNSAVSFGTDTYLTVIIALQDSVMHVAILNASHEVLYRGQLAAAVTKTVLLTPWFFCQTRVGSASKTLDIDKLHLRQHVYT
jgi:hypothetical protein